MVNQHIDIILLISGIATASLIIQVVAPRYALASFFNKHINDPFTLFLARASGLPIAMLGLLLIWAAIDPVIRTPIIAAVLTGKALFLALIAMHWEVTGRGYTLTLLVDGVTVLLLSLYLLGL